MKHRAEMRAGIERVRNQGRQHESGEHRYGYLPANQPSLQQEQATQQRHAIDPGEAAGAERPDDVHLGDYLRQGVTHRQATAD